MKRKLKLLFVYPEMMVGGSTTCLLSLLDRIDKERFEVDLLLYFNRGKMLDQVPKGVRLLPQASKDNDVVQRKRKLILTMLNGGLLKAVYCIWKYRKNKTMSPASILRLLLVPAQVTISRKVQQEYDVAIGFVEYWSDAYVASSRVHAKKKIGWIHPDYQMAGFFREGDYSYISRLDEIITVSKNSADRLSAIYPELACKVRTLENILPEESIRKKAEEEISFTKKDNCLYILTVCRIDNKSKGLDRVVTIFEKFKDEIWFEDVRWIIVGNGPDFVAMEQLIKAKGLESQVFLVGEKTNPYPYYRKADLFMLPSRYEGKPMVVEEALLLGLPCIITDYPAATEQVIDGENGLIMDNTDRGIEDGLRELLMDRERVMQLKSNAISIITNNEEKYKQFVKVIST